jgi:hypothetical protein
VLFLRFRCLTRPILLLSTPLISSYHYIAFHSILAIHRKRGVLLPQRLRRVSLLLASASFLPLLFHPTLYALFDPSQRCVLSPERLRRVSLLLPLPRRFIPPLYSPFYAIPFCRPSQRCVLSPERLRRVSLLLALPRRRGGAHLRRMPPRALLQVRFRCLAVLFRCFARLSYLHLHLPGNIISPHGTTVHTLQSSAACADAHWNMSDADTRARKATPAVSLTTMYMVRSASVAM